MVSHSSGPHNHPQGSVLHETTHDGSGDLSVTVLEALDSLPGFDATSSDERLSDRIDPDALDALFQSTSVTDREPGRVSFPIQGYVVSVTASGKIVIRDSQS